MTKIPSGSRGGELELLRAIRLRAGKGPSARLSLGIGDDCALIRLRGTEELAVTTDLSIVGRHFRLDWHSPEAVGHRTLARGLSDLAAMGARPVAAFLSLGVPRELMAGVPSWTDGFLRGIFALAEAYETPLAGGDLAESPVALADIVLTGAVPKGKALLRSGARAGDLLYVTGMLGGAAAGLAKLAELAGMGGGRPPAIPSRDSAILAPHLYPQPRVRQGLALQQRSLATAAIDVSDGISTDLGHLCEESGVGAIVEREALPVAPGASLEQALHGGEDYELLFAARPSVRVPGRIEGVVVTRIGRMIKVSPRGPAVMLSQDGRVEPLQARGWEHFSGSEANIQR